MPVDAVVGDVELAADEPLGERQVPLEGRVERPRPVDPLAGESRPEGLGVGLGLVVQLGVALAWAVNAGSGGKVRSSARRFSISGDGVGTGRRSRGTSGISGARRRPRATPLAAGRSMRWSVGSSAALVAGGRRLGRDRRAAARAAGSRARTTRCGRGISMPCASERARRRLRSSPPAAHWSGARTVPRILSVTPYSPSASIRSTCGARGRGASSRVGGHLRADLVDDLGRLVDVGAVGDRDVLVDARPDAGQVRGDLDLAVGHRVDDAVEVAQGRPPQAEVLDRAGDPGDASPRRPC